jgi:site-specific DNA-methyltransferase (adenine-specific)
MAKRRRPTNTILGDCLVVMKEFDDNSFTAIVTDPPYHLRAVERPGGKTRPRDIGFAGEEWDGGNIAFRPETWKECLRVTKPGGVLLAFGGARTFHRLSCAIEAAGWELRDTLCWLYATGYPPSRNFVGTFAGYGTSLKPSWEPIVLAVKPYEGGTWSANAAKNGVAGLNIEGCRTEDGRWPTNLILDCGCKGRHVASCPVQLLNKEVGPRHSVGGGRVERSHGGVSRFFYCCRSYRGDRDSFAKSKHPTRKPLDLMRWLVRLVKMPSETMILDPFAGSGTTLLAAACEGVDAVGIEKRPDYYAEMRARLAALGRRRRVPAKLAGRARSNVSLIRQARRGPRAVIARAEEARPLAEHGEIGNGRSRDDNVSSTSAGNSAEYLTARIARDRPDILEQMKRGEFKSVRAAAKAAGIVKDRSRP